MMKTSHIFGIFSALFIVLVFALAINNINQPVAFAQEIDAASVFQQATPVTIPVNQSEIGSTDGILIMGIVIAVIVILPLQFRKKKKK